MFKEMDHRRRNHFVDFSSFFLVEATGDSEADYDPNVHKTDMDHHLSAYDEDDAESCSFEDNNNNNDGEEEDYSDHSSSCVTDPIVGFRLQANQSWERRSSDYMEVEEDEEAEQEQEVVWGFNNNKRWNPGQKFVRKSCVSADSANKSMNEEEKSKLFWETCLAS